MSRLLLVLVFAACLVAAPGSLSAQRLVEPFEGGFSPGLNWQGDLDAFQSTLGELQLNDTRPSAPGRARVWVSANTQDSACYQLTARLEFSPSTSNRATWWLDADQGLDQPNVQGHYLRLGGISGADDAYQLFYANGMSDVLVLETSPGSAASDPVDGTLVVCGDGTQWALDVTFADGSDERVVGDSPAPPNGVFTGFDLEYTSSRSDAFFFDDLVVGPLFVDVTAPQLVLAEAVDERTIRLVASEPLAATNQSPSLYVVSGNSITQVELDGATLILTLANELPDGQDVDVTVQRFVDLAGNASSPITTQVRYDAPRQLEAYAVVFSEIMADPSPPLGLPEVEYLELSNRSGAPIMLRNLRLATSRDTVRLPDVQLPAEALIALAADDVGDSRFTTFADLPALVNSGMTLTLIADDGSVLDQVAYTPDWHDSSKDDGGYSLERIDLARACLTGAINWGSSVALSGGTPGAANSIADVRTLDSLSIQRAEILDGSTVLIVTNARLDQPATSFSLSSGSIAGVELGATPGSYLLRLTEPLTLGQLTELSLAPDAQACGTTTQISRAAISLGLADAAQVGDWELNEIMYDPLSGDGRYLELVNVSDRLLSASELNIAVLDADGLVDQLLEPEQEIVVPPGGFVVYSDDAVRLQARYPSARSTAVVPSDVPTLSDEDCLQLFDPVTETIFWTVCYSEDWHNRAYANTDGVSLERISLARSANDPDNWTSAASTVGFGTPTLPNSQALSSVGELDGQFTLASERLSPDGDGFEDLLLLNYRFDTPGVLARFEVYDVQGRAVKTTSEDESSGIEGLWTWDGTTDDGVLASVGTYVVRVTYWSPESPREREFLPVSLLLR